MASNILRPQEGPQTKFLATPADICIYGGGAGGGKAQPVDEKVLTKNGFVKMGTIKIGDEVCTPFGTTSKIKQIHPQGYRSVIKMIFDDDTYVRCTLDHLWPCCYSDIGMENYDVFKSECIHNMIEYKETVYIPFYNPDTGYYAGYNKKIKKFALDGIEECQCITIEDSRGLYITSNYAITHNSFGLLLTPLRYKNVQGFGCTIFRKNVNQIFSQGGLWDTSVSIYGGIRGAIPKPNKGEWQFTDKNGNVVSKVNFAHIERDVEVLNWQGTQIAELCCEENTPVLMADMSYKAIKDIRIGDSVMTLQGERKVTKIGNRKLKPCVKIKTKLGEQICTTDHKVLTNYGWISCDDNVENIYATICKPNAKNRNLFKYQYEHPYTGKILYSTEKRLEISHDRIEFFYVPDSYTIDITVDDCNHYITKCGLVNKNCFDELTHFSKKTFFYMLSRNRSSCGVKPFVRATCNPDSDSWVAEFIDWWIDPNTGYPIPERSGKLRWFIQRDEVYHWADTKEELWEQFNLITPEEKEEPRSVTFIMSLLTDNKALLEVNPSYMANLKALPEVERERLLMGNWKIRAAAGMFFKRTQLGNVLSTVPLGITQWVRCWDLAATEKTPKGDPAYTAGVLIGKQPNGRYIVADVINRQMAAVDVRKTIEQTAQMDVAKYKRVRIRLPRDPGQAGKEQAETYIKMLAGYDVTTVIESGSKETRAEPVAAQWQAGNFDIVYGPWNEAFLYQLENFPDGKFKDMVDAFANGFTELENKMAFNLKYLIT